ncbi:sensor histidine kinase [Nocardioides sp.]|uniref:sensor histidine kinase n=1 Tax=Nocardioides sp. TaxID=35761 RepID=UPI002B2662F6|nr:sensor histidine kinase [Nocardioides sp.]
MRRRLPLAAQLLALQVGIVLLVLVGAGWLALQVQRDQVRDANEDRVLALARGLGGQESVRDAYASPAPSGELQPLAELVRTSAGAEFVVFTDADGLRYSHPDPAKIGQRVSTDPSVALGGQEYVGTEAGTLGLSLRAKVPVRAADGTVLGQVSVGILERELEAGTVDVLPRLVLWLTGAAVVGVLGAIGVTRLVRRRIHGLEPEEIADLLRAREAMLHGIREGVLAVDNRGRVSLVNDEAMRLLGLTDDPTHRSVQDVLHADELLPLVTGDEEVADQVVLVGERLLVVNSTIARVRGRVVGRLLVLRDRTELFDALRALDGQRTITEALRAQAHEFSNHLHVLSGLMGLGRSEEAVRFIERVGGGTVSGTGAPLADVEDPMLAALLVAKAAVAREKNLQLHLDPASEVLAGVGDDVLTIVAKLVDNAIEASPETGHIEVLLRHRPGGATRVEVRDEGSGVPEHLRERIFDAGVTTKADAAGLGEAHGRGIGLALVSRIVRRRGGTLRVDHVESGGSVFAVLLPDRQPAAARTPARAEP